MALCRRNKALVYLNLTWCLALTDIGIVDGVCTLPNGLNLLSMFGNTTITQVSLDALSAHRGHSQMLKTLDLNGCSGIAVQNREETHLKRLFPNC